MAAVAAARAISRTTTLRNVAAKVVSSEAKAARTSLPLPKHRPSAAAPRFLRSPVEMSCCVESLLPMHSVTASALMTSMLSVSRRGCGWLSEGLGETK